MMMAFYQQDFPASGWLFLSTEGDDDSNTVEIALDNLLIILLGGGSVSEDGGIGRDKDNAVV